MARLKEECGVFGIFNNKDAAALTALGLHALQHRWQEACGIVTFNEKKFYAEITNLLGKDLSYINEPSINLNIPNKDSPKKFLKNSLFISRINF